jgi:uncharacterized DUF497 family protein
MTGVQYKFLIFQGFEWDDGNLSKVQKHGVGIAEIEIFFEKKIILFPDTKHSQVEERFVGVGENENGRPLMVIFTFRFSSDQVFVRVLSARYMHKKERRNYEKFKKDNQEES